MFFGFAFNPLEEVIRNYFYIANNKFHPFSKYFQYSNLIRIHKFINKAIITVKIYSGIT